MRKAAIPIPYIIALIFGIIALAVLGYWLYTQSGKIIGTGGSIECQAKQQTYCQQWKILSGFYTLEPYIDFPAGCPKPNSENCRTILGCTCSSTSTCSTGFQLIGDTTGRAGCLSGYYLCCPI